jgi:hypothetical protein
MFLGRHLRGNPHRLFLLSLVIWLFHLIGRSHSRATGATMFWGRERFGSGGVGAGHLPFAAGIAPLTPALVVAVVMINAFVALPFGYLYWRRGLEAAMIAHFSPDLVLHVITAALS